MRWQQPCCDIANFEIDVQANAAGLGNGQWRLCWHAVRGRRQLTRPPWKQHAASRMPAEQQQCNGNSLPQVKLPVFTIRFLFFSARGDFQNEGEDSALHHYGSRIGVHRFHFWACCQSCRHVQTLRRATQVDILLVSFVAGNVN